MNYTPDQLTPVFPGNVKPVRTGLYLRVYCSFGDDVVEHFDYFDGEKWRYANPIGCACSFQSRAWRGLNFDPTWSGK